MQSGKDTFIMQPYIDTFCFYNVIKNRLYSSN